MEKFKILDTTLRDGSYTVNFSFSFEETQKICKALESSGLELIEIGHGVGLGASEKGFGKSSQTDEEYMIAARDALSKSKYGMFCIPGIASLDDIDLAAKHEMNFIRIGTNISNVDQSKDFIKKSKDYGMFVCSNYMKSYSSTPSKFAEKVKLSESYGADCVYVVDSAGGMFNKDVTEYINAIKNISDIQFGFHGHDNLGLSISNTLTAIEMGSSLIDSSLQGLGRSSGNACTEILVLVLKKLGYEIPINEFELLNIGYDLIQPKISNKGKFPLDLISGYADFHTSYMPHILSYSKKYDVDPAHLIIELTKIDKVNLDLNTLKKLSEKLHDEGFTKPSNIEYLEYVGNEQDEK